MTKVEEQESNDNEGSLQSSTSREIDIKNQLRKNHNKKKVNHEDDISRKKSKKLTGSYWRDPCKEILEILKKDEKAALFRHPAIRSFASKRDKEIYKEQIKEPRDLGTITKKLKNENYTPKDFKNDIELCWSNAIAFNEDDTDVYKYALYLKELSDKLFKEKSFEVLLEKYNNEKDKETSNSITEEKDTNINDNTNNSNNNTNDSNNTVDKLNLNESGLMENGIKEKNRENNEEKDSKEEKDAKKDKKRKDSLRSNSSNKSVKDDESDNGNEHKKHHHHKMTGKKRHRHHHKDKEKGKEKIKEDNNEEEKKEKKRGRRKKIDNDNIIKISKKKINFDDIKKKYPINYPVIISPEEIEKMAQKKGKNKIKKMIKLNNTNKNHENHHRSENHKRRGRIANNNKTNNNIIKNEEIEKNVTYKFDWEFPGKENEPQIDSILIDNKYIDKRAIENEKMGNYDINCNSDNTPNIYRRHHKINNNNNNPSTNHSIINGITEIHPKKKKNDLSKNKTINNNSINIINNNTNNSNNTNNISIHSNESDANKNNNIEIVQKSNNVSIDNSINEIKMVPEVNNNAVKIVEKINEKNMELRIEVSRYFDNLTDSNMIDLLVYIENIRPQSIRILENDTIYIDMDAFNEETFSKVIDFIKNIS